MQINKTHIVATSILAVLIGVTAFFVLKAPRAPGSAASAAEPEGLNKPRGLALLKNGDIVIVDSKNNRIVVQKPDGSLVKRFGRLGTAKGDLREPCDVAVDKDGDLYVADTFHTLDPAGGLPWGRVQKFDDDFDFKAVLAKPEEGSGEFFGPRAIAIDPQERIWLSDTGNHRLVVYGKDGKFLKSVGQKGKGKLEFEEPFGLDFDGAGNAYVADRLNFRVQIVSKDFQYVDSFKVDGWDATQINMEPYVAVDQARKLVWVSDPIKNRVHSYGFDGKKKASYDKGLDHGAPAPFSLPTGLALAPDGTLYVGDGGSGRILTLKP